MLVVYKQGGGVASRCIDMALGQDLQPLPPGVQRCSLPKGLLQPDVSPPQQKMDSKEGGESRVVGGSPATSGEYGGGSPAYPPSAYPPGNPSPFGKPDQPWPFGTPGKPAFGGVSGQYGRPSGPGQYGGPVNYGGPDGPTQYSGRYGDGAYRPRVEMKPPGIPYIPSPKEWGGGRIPVSKDNPNYGSAPFGGGAGSYNPGDQYPPSYGGPSGLAGPRGRYDGSYGPIPYGGQPGGGQTKTDTSDPCTPEC
ncbi:UNVERIFIED_CONTAM: hypothetical protein K2H54_059940 [Gekko kuhli]